MTSVADLHALAASGVRFSVIYADPPWIFKTYSEAGKGRSAERHYGCLGLDRIAALPVGPLAANNCALFLWCTWPHIARGTHVEIMRAWGFEPKTAGFNWVKQNRSGQGLHLGMGFWTRSNSEVCFLGTRGKPRRFAADVRQVVLTPVGEHSAKPEEVRRRIERLVAGPYLELFAREQRPGWVAWGDQINKSDQSETVTPVRDGQPDLFAAYDPQDDLAKSIKLGFETIRERVRSGGRGWNEH
jgi:N6-adenosine-specific RNA methylase IME4